MKKRIHKAPPPPRPVSIMKELMKSMPQPIKETPTAVYYPAEALPATSKQPQGLKDLNGDGILDVKPTPRYESFEHLNPPEKFFMELGGLKTATGGLIRFGVASPEIRNLCGSKSVVVCADPNAHFHIPNTTLSFAPGQRVMAISADGRHGEVFALKGIALKFPLGPVNLDVHPTELLDPEHFGYGTSKGNIIEVPLTQLRWVIGTDEIIDPDRLVRGGTPQNEAEGLLQNLFLQAAKIPKDAKQVTALFENWKKAASLIDPGRTQEIMKEPLWIGIRIAVAKLAGLSPADFPG